MTSPEQKQSPQQASRRKLVRGAFAVPAVMTVVSGSALATTSSMKCLTNQVNHARFSAPVSSSTDAYLRVPLWKTVTGTAPHLVTTYYVAGSDLHTMYKRTGNSITVLTNSQWQKFDVSTNTLTGSVLHSMPAGATKCTDKFAIVQFNAGGSVVGVGVNSTSSSAVYGTCWTSFAPNLGL